MSEAPVITAPLLIDEPEARRLLGGISAKTIYLWRTQEALPHLKIRGRTLYDAADLAAWVAARKTPMPEVTG